MAGIDVTGWDYMQEGLVATVTTLGSHQHSAWQRFLEQGPLAFLPLKNGQSSIVWTLSPETAQQYLALPESEFLERLEQASAGILGGMMGVGPRASFPLRRVAREDCGRTELHGVDRRGTSLRRLQRASHWRLFHGLERIPAGHRYAFR